jgi:hypothetical protein
VRAPGFIVVVFGSAFQFLSGWLRRRAISAASPPPAIVLASSARSRGVNPGRSSQSAGLVDARSLRFTIEWASAVGADDRDTAYRS